jgi:septal ring factor EnvC (AmiA/AmiB activator)
MHIKFFSLISLVFSIQIAFGQSLITVNEEMISINGEERNSLTVIIKGASTDDVKKAWKKQLKDLKGKVDDKTVIFGDDCKDKSMGDNTFDVYSVVEPSLDTAAKLVAAFDLGGAYMTSTDHPEQFIAAKKIVRTFAVEQEKAAVQMQIDAKEKELKGLDKDLGGLKKDKEKSEKNISDSEAKIAANKESITGSIASQKAKQSEIHRLEEGQIENHSDEVAKVIKGYEKELDGMKKDKAGLEKDNEKLAEKIKEEQGAIQENEKAQEQKSAEIDSMNKEIKALQGKLNSIK